MITMTVSRVISTSSNGLRKPWGPVWVSYHDGVDGTDPIPLYKKGIRTKYPIKDALGPSWNSGRSLLDRASFIKWDNNGTGTDKPWNINFRFLFNRLAEYINTFRRIFQESIQTYSPKDQFWEAKLQSCPEPVNSGFIMYRTHSLQVKDIIHNVIKIIEKEQGQEMEITIQSEAAFQTDKESRILYKASTATTITNALVVVT